MHSPPETVSWWPFLSQGLQIPKIVDVWKLDIQTGHSLWFVSAWQCQGPLLEGSKVLRLEPSEIQQQIVPVGRGLFLAKQDSQLGG